MQLITGACVIYKVKLCIQLVCLWRLGSRFSIFKVIVLTQQSLTISMTNIYINDIIKVCTHVRITSKLLNRVKHYVLILDT